MEKFQRQKRKHENRNRGFKNLNWATAKDFLGRDSFKIELK